MRLSVSGLDAFRRYRDTEDADLDALLRQLRKEEPPSRPMLAGSAFHHVLEHAGPGSMDYAEANGFKFRLQVDCDLPLPAIRELKGEVQLTTKSGPVTLVGVVDGMDGVEVWDHKLTARFDAERYAESYQWRCYLTMFGGTKFTYNIFVGKDDEDLDEWVITEFHPLTFYAYPAMRDDVMREIEQFAAFAAKYLYTEAA